MSSAGCARRFTQEQVEEALRKTGGNITLAAAWLARASGGSCHRNTVVNYLDYYPELRDIIPEAREELLDMAEAGLRDLVRKKDRLAIFKVIDTLGKDRGYSQRMEYTGPKGGPIQSAHTISLADLTDEQLAVLEQIADSLTAPIGNPGGEDPA